jgi:hypothetical protein
MCALEGGSESMEAIFRLKDAHYSVTYGTVDLTTATGVLKGLHNILTAGETDYLLKEFQTFYARTHSWKVSRAGEFIWDSLTKENALDSDLSHYQKFFVELFRSGRANTVSPLCGCAHHLKQFEVLRKKLLRKRHVWLVTFLDILSSVDERLHVRLPGRKVGRADSERLSRFMLLNNFVIHHTNARGIGARKKLAAEMIQKMGPSSAAGERRDLLTGKNQLVLLKGTVGSYGNELGATTRREPCNGIKPFSTFSKAVWKTCPDKSSVEMVLCELGIPFGIRQIWIELQYPVTSVPIDFKRSLSLACPTVIDARGNWAFRPDRALDRTHGIARNLRNNSKGMPEVVHAPVPIQSVEDAIVWPETKTSWGQNSRLV